VDRQLDDDASISEEEQVDQILSSHRADRKELVPILLDVQRALGYIPEVAFGSIADYLRVPPGVIYGVATFYNEFRLVPIGKQHVKVCMGTACHLQGGGLILNAVERELDIEVGGVTPDREFSMDRVACVGCCSLAPVVLVNDVVHARMRTIKVEEILALAKRGDQGEVKDQADEL
jgi:NADH-quinone oxidoreductase subunit E